MILRGIILAEKKTNAMRILEKEKISYKIHYYDTKDGHIDGISVAKKMKENPNTVFKTLVTQGHSKNYYVFVIPVEKELNLKKAAKSVNEKNVEMIKVSEINKVTGYIRGGCSPIGMKKLYKTVFDTSAKNFGAIFISGGKIGFQIEASPFDIAKSCSGIFENITF